MDKGCVSKVPHVASSTEVAGVSLSMTSHDLYTEGMRRLQLAKSDTTKSEEAKAFLFCAAQYDHIWAVLKYADLMYRQRSYPEATRWYRRALDLAKGRCFERAASGDAYLGLGLIAQCNRLYDDAVTHFHQGAILANAFCQYYVGTYLHRGDHVKRNVHAAYNWYRRAVARGIGSCIAAPP